MKKLLKILSERPFLLFLPFLLLFIARILQAPPTGTSGDESRYLSYAQNLINGFYSPPPPNIELINGPGYPLFLVPFIWLKLPLIYITFANALLYYLSLVIFYKSLRRLFTINLSLIFGFLWACYYLGYQNINIIHTESMMCFLVTLLIFLTIKAFQSTNRKDNLKHLILAGFVLGYIALTRVIFGQVITLMLIGTAILYLLKRSNVNYKKAFLISLISLLTASPYLIYTYSLTGKAMVWGQGNDCLYWMTTNTPNEFGSWFPDDTQPLDPLYYTYYLPGTKDSIIKYHQKDFDYIKQFKGIEKDEEYRKLAMRNIKDHPLVFARNIVYNIGRMLYQYPFSYGVHRPKLLMAFPLHGILLTLMLLALIPTLINWKKIQFSIRFLLIIAIIYLGGSSLVTAYIRMFAIVVPIILIWIAFILERTLKFQFVFKEDPS